MDLPLSLRLKRQAHRDLAALQDDVVEIVYSLEKGAVLHGGTAIWRCLKGNRFSEDLDFYCIPSPSFHARLVDACTRRGFEVTKFRKTTHTIYSRIRSGRVEVSLEFALRHFPAPSVLPYEKVNGMMIDILTLSPFQFLEEKLLAFRSRKLIRDMYDVFHLSKMVEPTPAQRAIISPLLNSLPSPADESNLKNLVLSGIVPSFSQMVGYVRSRWSS